MLALEPFVLKPLGIDSLQLATFCLQPLGLEPGGVGALAGDAFLGEALGLEPLAVASFGLQARRFTAGLVGALAGALFVDQPLGLERLHPRRFGRRVLELRRVDLLEKIHERIPTGIDTNLATDQLPQVEHRIVGRDVVLAAGNRQDALEEPLHAAGEDRQSANAGDVEDLVAQRGDTGWIVLAAQRPADHE